MMVSSGCLSTTITTTLGEQVLPFMTNTRHLNRWISLSMIHTAFTMLRTLSSSTFTLRLKDTLKDTTQE